MRTRKKRKYNRRGFVISIFVTTIGGIGLYTHLDEMHLSEIRTQVQTVIYEIGEKILPQEEPKIELEDIPEYAGTPYVEINENIPQFDSADFEKETFEIYSSLDLLGRCGAAYAKLGRELMPDEERESISDVIPTGWQNQKYDGIEQGYLYNRCHLIGYQLAGENANEKNLITGTRYMNVEGMLPLENQVAAYIKETGNHVLYRVMPIYDGADMVASGVQVEAESVEDGGTGIKFNVYCYNVQPGIGIDYATGANWEK